MIDIARILRELSISPRRVRVWDPPIRSFHWLPVLAIAAAEKDGVITYLSSQ